MHARQQYVQRGLGEVNGFLITDDGAAATNARANGACRFHPGGVCVKRNNGRAIPTCSVTTGDGLVVTCPLRFNPEVTDVLPRAARFTFGHAHGVDVHREVRLGGAGRVDYVLSSPGSGAVGFVEVQAMYVSRGVGDLAHGFLSDPEGPPPPRAPAPKVDVVSSIQKRLVPQLVRKVNATASWDAPVAFTVVAQDHPGVRGLLGSVGAGERTDETTVMWLLCTITEDDVTHRGFPTVTHQVFTSTSQLLGLLHPGEADRDTFSASLPAKRVGSITRG